MDELMMENDERPKCACGCGMPVDCKLRSGAWGNYCHGHKKCPPVESDRHLCNCGCGNYVNWNSRTKEYNLYCKGHRLNNPLDAERRSTVAKNVYVNNPKLKEIRSNSSKAMWAKQEFRAGIKSRYRHKYEALHPEILDDPPLCACGCGGCVSFSRNKTEWNKYIKHHYKKQRKELDRPLCACGCGILVEKKRDGGWRKYCVGHNRGSVAKPERPLCACGCGNPVKWNREKKIWRNYIIGHSSRDTNFRKRQSDMMKSKWETVEYREFYKLVSERCRTPEYRARQREISTIRWQDPVYRKKNIACVTISQNRPDVKAKKSEYGKKRWQNEEYRQNFIKGLKIRWEDPAYVEKMMTSNSKRPNKPEAIIDMITPESVRYVGNRAWWHVINIEINGSKIKKHCNPDFKIKDQNKVIEVFGDYWHCSDNVDAIMQAWKDIDFECLIIWEHEIYEDIGGVLKSIADFIGQDSWQMSLAI